VIANIRYRHHFHYRHTALLHFNSWAVTWLFCELKPSPSRTPPLLQQASRRCRVLPELPARLRGPRRVLPLQWCLNNLQQPALPHRRLARPPAGPRGRNRSPGFELGRVVANQPRCFTLFTAVEM
jgi:hypothetical protein